MREFFDRVRFWVMLPVFIGSFWLAGPVARQDWLDKWADD